MTVSSQTSTATFVGNGVATAFPLPFRFFENGDIRAYFIDSVTGAATQMVLGSDYTLIGAGEPEVDGNALSLLTTTAPLASMHGLYVERFMPQTQSTDLVNQGEFFASTHEDVFDRLTMLIQQQVTETNKAKAEADKAKAEADEAMAIAQEMVARQEAFENNYTYVILGQYAAGLVFTSQNQVFSYDAGSGAEFYAPGPSITLPYTTTGAGAGEIANFRSVGDATLRQDLASPTGSTIVYDEAESLKSRLNPIRALVSVESFRTTGLSDSNTIRAALDYIESNLVGKMTILVFEASREYVYDRTAELRTINNLIIDLNGATLKRAPAAATKTTLALIAGTGQSTLYLTSIPSNWEVGDFLAAYVDNTDAGVSHNTCRITAIVRAENRVNISMGFGKFGGYTATIPAGTTIAKKFSAFAGRPSNTEANIPTPGGVNYNVHIINGVINGNAANQENNSWYFNSEIFLHGRHSSIRNMGFANTAGECIVGHGVRVDGCTFQDLKGSCFHLSMHDESWASASASWFTNNFVDRVNLATQNVNGHCEGAITFSWGAGRLIVTGNEFSNGTESVLGAFGPATEAENPDKWLIFSNNLCRNFERLFYAISAPAEGVVVTDNILVDCESSTFQMDVLLGGKSNIVGGNSCIGNSAVGGAYRATNAVFGAATSTIESLPLLVGKDVPGFDKWRMSGAVLSAVMHPTRAFRAYATGAAGEAGDTFYSPGGSYAGEFFRQWIPATRRYELLGNIEGGGVRVVIKSATLNLDHTQTRVDNAAALASGMVTGDVYATPTGHLMRVY